MIFHVQIEETVERSLILFLEAPSIADITAIKNVDELLDQLPSYNSGDWEEYEEGARITNVHKHGKLRRVGGETLAGYVLNGKVYKRKDYYKEKKVIKLRPLPGQLGIPGIAKDIPLKEDD